MGVLDCYGAELDTLADVAGDFDYLSTHEREAWIAGQWTTIAEAMGWSDALEAAFERIRTTRLGLAQSTAVAVAAFREVASRDMEDQANTARARVRQTVLMTLGARTTNVWRIDVDAASVPSGVCFSTNGAHESEGALRESAEPLASRKPGRGSPGLAISHHRVFLADSGPSYYWDPAPRTIHYRPGCGLDAPLRLSLGTFPWVYGRRLQAPAPGGLWRSSGEHVPAAVGLEIATSLWHPAGNLRQDAREVVAHWRHWRDTTRELVTALPESSESATSGGLYRSGALIHTDDDRQIVGLNGPRGFICVTAYNFIQRRFAAFFAMRRALLRARGGLPQNLRALIDANPDPCLRQHLNLNLAEQAGA